MADYGHELGFGYFLVPDAADPNGLLEAARLADRLGYDLLAVQDHPYQPAHLGWVYRPGPRDRASRRSRRRS